MSARRSIRVDRITHEPLIPTPLAWVVFVATLATIGALLEGPKLLFVCTGLLLGAPVFGFVYLPLTRRFTGTPLAALVMPFYGAAAGLCAGPWGLLGILVSPTAALAGFFLLATVGAAVGAATATLLGVVGLVLRLRGRRPVIRTRPSRLVEGRGRARLGPTYRVLLDPASGRAQSLGWWLLRQPAHAALEVLAAGGPTARALFPDLDHDAARETPTVVGPGGEVWQGEAAWSTLAWMLVSTRARVLRPDEGDTAITPRAILERAAGIAHRAPAP